MESTELSSPGILIPTAGDTPKISPVLQQDGVCQSQSLISAKNHRRISSSARHDKGDSTPPYTTFEGVDDFNETPVLLSDTLKRHLETDYVNVTKKRRLTRIPAEPNAVTVLEDFVRHYAAAKMVSYEKQRSKTFYTSNRREESKMCYEKAVDSINLAKEVN